MTRMESNLAWAVALFVAALILGLKDSNPLPWALGAAAVIVGFFTLALMGSRNKTD